MVAISDTVSPSVLHSTPAATSRGLIAVPPSELFGLHDQPPDTS